MSSGSERTVANKDVGNLTEIPKIPIPYWFGLAAAVLALTAAYWYFEESKVISFFASGIGISAALLGAVYVERVCAGRSFKGRKRYMTEGCQWLSALRNVGMTLDW